MHKAKIPTSPSPPPTLAGIMAWVIPISLAILLGLSIGILVVSSNTNSQVGALLPNVPQFIGSCGAQRHLDAYSIRVQKAIDNYLIPPPCQVDNGDESLYSDRRAQYSKSLLHDSTTGLVIPSYYSTFLSAVNAKNFNIVSLAPNATNKLTDPLGGLAVDLVGSDAATSILVPPPPTFSSAEQASEYVENAWMALLRDVPFDQYGTNGTAAAAISELNLMTGFTGPKPVNPSSLFRGNCYGCLTGPYLSQFFYQPISYGVSTINMKITPPTAGRNYMTNMTTWLNVQNGQTPTETATYEPFERYMINGRDLGRWVEVDMLQQAYHQAVMYLLSIGAPFNPTNPYLHSQTSVGFGTFGAPHVTVLMTEVATRALHAAWNSKWFVNRRLRPEVLGARVDRNKKGIFPFNVHSQALNSVAGATLNLTYGGYFIPQAYVSGSPTHPSYLAGHATVSSACITILKAFFDGSFIIPSPLIPNANGSALIPYIGNLTVEGELNKLSANVALGRNIAGVHFRSDYVASVVVGEQVAIATLRDYKGTFAETFSSWRFNNLNGNPVIV